MALPCLTLAPLTAPGRPTTGAVEHCRPLAGEAPTGTVMTQPDTRPLNTVSDDTLVLRVAAGDAPAFHALSARHLNRTLTLAWRVLGSRSDAEDVTQEAFLRLWQHAHRFRPNEARFSTWFYRITLNLCLDRRRRPAFEDIDAIPEPVDPGTDAVTHIAERERARLVAQAIARLPDRQRHAIALCYDGGLSNAEAAAALSISVGALETLLVRARRSLRQYLSPLLADDGDQGTARATPARRGGPR